MALAPTLWATAEPHHMAPHTYRICSPPPRINTYQAAQIDGLYSQKLAYLHPNTPSYCTPQTAIQYQKTIISSIKTNHNHRNNYSSFTLPAKSEVWSS